MDLTQHPKATGFEFPCDTVLVAFGPAGTEFVQAIEGAIDASGVRRQTHPIQTRLSSAGNYQSVHVPVYVESRAQLEAVYRSINAVPGLKFKL